MQKIIKQKYIPKQRNADNHYQTALCSAQENAYEKALTAIEQAIQEEPYQALYYNTQGNILKKLNLCERAESAYKKAIRMNRDYAIAYNNLGALFYQQKKYIAAQKSYEKALSLKNNYSDALKNYRILGDYYLLSSQFSFAEKIFLALTQWYSNTEYHHRLGITYFHQKNYSAAKQQFEIVLDKNSRYEDANQFLGNTLLELREHDRAMHYYFRQLEYLPTFETYYNLGVLLMMKDKLRDAVMYFDKAQSLKPEDVAVYKNLGHIYLKQNNVLAATAAYQKADDLQPNDPETRYFLSALLKRNTFDQAPKEYISNLFDQYAAYYDKQLKNYLKYDVPQKIMSALQLEFPEVLQDNALDVVDLGCGTGLCGELLRPFSKKLTGVDLSQQMIAVAQSKNCYDQLMTEDITAALLTLQDIDLIVAADVLPYFGNLEKLLSTVKNALSPRGIFAFSIEKTHVANFVLQTTMRYAHSRIYIESLAKTYAFQIARFDNAVLRQNQGVDVEGYLIFLKIK